MDEDQRAFLDRVALRAKELRLQAGLTQEAVAESIATAVSNYQRIEGGRQNLSLLMLLRLAKTFGVDPEELLRVPKLKRIRRRRRQA